MVLLASPTQSVVKIYRSGGQRARQEVTEKELHHFFLRSIALRIVSGDTWGQYF